MWHVDWHTMKDPRFRGLQIVTYRNGRRNAHTSAKKWKPTAFEAELLDRGIEMINSRPYHHPQTNGKIERLYQSSIENEIWHHESMSGYVRYYNEERLHGSLDIDNCETPLLAFGRRKSTEAIRKDNPKWMEEDTDDDDP